MEWGTKASVPTERDALAHIGAMRAELPETKSAYVPSGKLPPEALLWLGLGSLLGVPTGALAGIVLGGITLLLFTLVALAIAAMAAVCGRVLCVVMALELLVGLAGAALTFGAIGAVPGWLTAWAGKRGNNRNAWAAVLFSIPSAVIAFVLVALLPQLGAQLVGPADPSEDFSIPSLVHTLADPSWGTLALYGLGFLVAVGGAGLFAYETVGAQKFCEVCHRYMDEAALRGLAVANVRAVIDAIRRGAPDELGAQLAIESGRDVEAFVFSCPGCQRGYFEARAHAHAEWTTADGKNESRTENWLCVSVETLAPTTRALVALKRPDEEAAS